MLNLKICGLTDKINIETIIELDPNQIGFIFYDKSVRNILSKKLQNIIRSVPKHIYKVGVFVDMNFERVQEIINEYELNMIQLYHEDISAFQSLRTKVKIIKALNIGELLDIEKTNFYSDQVDYFLFDTKGNKHGGNGTKFDWQILKQYKGSIPFILSGGIGLEDAQEIQNLHVSTLYGVDINSRFEIADGIKNTELIKQFKKKLQNENT